MGNKFGGNKLWAQKIDVCYPLQVREFLKSAPTKGLWMPLGKEVKVMQCWRCKQYGHRTGDKECTLASKGNLQNEQFRKMHEDPMYHMMRQKVVRLTSLLYV